MRKPGINHWQLRACEQIITGNEGLLGQEHFLIGVTRLRNEALILPDTLDYVGKHVDAIIAYDDASTDRTPEILRRHPGVALTVRNEAWEDDIQARLMAEARHRGLLLELARAQLQFDWMFCFDADERVCGRLAGLTATRQEIRPNRIKAKRLATVGDPTWHALSRQECIFLPRSRIRRNQPEPRLCYAKPVAALG